MSDDSRRRPFRPREPTGRPAPEPPERPPGEVREPAERPFGAAALRVTVGLLAAVVLAAGPAAGQQTRVGDLVQMEEDVPVRLVGYGLVTGLDGTGDRTIGGFSGGHTVRSIANLLRRFDVRVPPEALRTRNVAAVLVTAEVSPYLRPGGRFEVKVSSVGDASSLRGGVLWMTPLVARPGGDPVATAQGGLVLSRGVTTPGERPVETSARVPDGGLLRGQLPRGAMTGSTRLLLRDPELGTATRIASAVNEEFGEGTARVEDPGSVAVELSDDVEGGTASALARIRALQVEPVRTARLVIDGRDGTVVAGGGLQVGEAVVSHGGMTLTVGGGIAGQGGGGGGQGGGGQGGPGGQGPPGAVRVASGATVQAVASALHAVAAPPEAIANIFRSLEQVGALSAPVEVR